MKETQEDATKLLIQWLRNHDQGGYPTFGYDICLTNFIRGYLKKK